MWSETATPLGVSLVYRPSSKRFVPRGTQVLPPTFLNHSSTPAYCSIISTIPLSLSFNQVMLHRQL